MSFGKNGSYVFPYKYRGMDELKRKSSKAQLIIQLN